MQTLSRPAHRLLLVIPALCAALLISSGCATRDEPTTTPMAELISRDLPNLSGEPLLAARRGIDQARGASLDEALMPLKVWALGEHHLLLMRDTREPLTLRLELINEGIRWQRELPLNGTWGLESYALGSHPEVNHPVLVIDTKPPRGHDPMAATRLYLAITGNGGLLIRAVNPGRQIVDQRLSEDHPDLRTDPGDITHQDSAAQLAGLVHLAQPAHDNLRSGARVIGHLEALAGGTNRWLAEGAALVLTLP